MKLIIFDDPTGNEAAKFIKQLNVLESAET